MALTNTMIGPGRSRVNMFEKETPEDEEHHRVVHSLWLDTDDRFEVILTVPINKPLHVQ